MASPAMNAPIPILEDPLAYLPCSSIEAFPRGANVYQLSRHQAGLFLVIEGAVVISRRTKRHDVALEFCMPDDFFGESALVGEGRQTESAVAFYNTKVMVWSVPEVEAIIAGRPRLATALLQMVIRRELELARRVESLSSESIPRRLAAAIVHFARRTGEPQDGGAVAMPPFTHEFFAQYVGTSREIVTQYMNQFRRLGFVRYSRRGIFADVQALRDWQG